MEERKKVRMGKLDGRCKCEGVQPSVGVLLLLCCSRLHKSEVIACVQDDTQKTAAHPSGISESQSEANTPEQQNRPTH